MYLFVTHCLGISSPFVDTRAHTACINMRMHTHSRVPALAGTTALQPETVSDGADRQACDGQAEMGDGVQGCTPLVRLVHEPSGEQVPSLSHTWFTIQTIRFWVVRDKRGRRCIWAS